MFSKIRILSKLPQQLNSLVLKQNVRMYSVANLAPTGVVNTESAAPDPKESGTVDNGIPDDEHSKKPAIVDIDIEQMMYDDPELEISMRLPKKEEPIINQTDIFGAAIAPVDVNPWIDEDELHEGTVEFENVQRMKRDRIEYPPIPEKRDGTFQCKGIQIRLPSKTLNEATYRYRMDPEDQVLPEDRRICKFD